jgi:nanoRNase/pAp phosphatase (c-di-AMP/oligoRNAs hydrolase)
LLPGRYSSKLHNKFESINKKSITIVVFRNYISFRIGRSISDEVNILEIIKDIKSNTEFVESGGGHKEAASMKIDETKVNIILKLVLNKLEIK